MGGQTVAQGNSSIPALNESETKQANTMIIQGKVELLPATGKHRVEAATLKLQYWPDRNRPDSYGMLTRVKTLE